MLDLLIKNGTIADGTGSALYKANVAVSEGKILGITAETPDSAVEIDAGGKIVSPGFVDVHAHYDYVPLKDPYLRDKIGQGVTTMLVGLCGLSIQPVLKDKIQLIDRYTGYNRSGIETDYSWGDTAGYLDKIEKSGIGINMAALVGHGTLRIDAMGFDDRLPTKREMKLMERLLSASLEQGAFGMSLGLIYPPGVYSRDNELVRLAAVLEEYGAVLATHMWNESDRLIDSVRRSIAIAEKTGVSLEIHHLKSIGRENWGRAGKAVELIEEANGRGLDVNADQYHYTYGCGPLSSLLPPWVHAGGTDTMLSRLSDAEFRDKIAAQMLTDRGYENLYIGSGGDGTGVTLLYCPETPQLQGLTLAEAGDRLKMPPAEAAMEVLVKNGGGVKAAVEVASEADIETVLRCGYVMAGSDANRPAPGAMCHPRTYGEFPRILSRYVREKKVLTLEEAVRRMTSLPCEKYGFKDKGRIKNGYDADIVIFDRDNIRDKAALDNCTAMPEGIECVLVNGTAAFSNGRYSDSLSGKILRRA